MNKLFLLVKVQFLGLFGLNRFRYSKDHKERQKSGLLFGGVLVLGLFFFAFSFLYSMMMAQTFRLTGMGTIDLLPALMMTAVSLMILFTTIYKVNGLLFGFKDYDLTMSLPVRSGVVVASRVMVLYLMNILFAFVLLVPMGVVYAIETAPGWEFYPAFLLTFFFVPLIPLVIATILGSLVMKIASRFRRSNLLAVALTMLVCVGVIVISMNPGIYENFAGISASVMDQVYRYYPLSKMYVDAICGENLLSLAAFVGISAIVFLLFCVVLGKWFQPINSALSARYAGGKFKMRELRQSSPFRALFRKEMRRYLSSAIYVTNTAVGYILALLLAVALLFFRPEQLEQMLEMPGISPVICAFVPLLMGFMIGISPSTGASISLEGKNLWILKSAPVSPRTILWSKIAVTLSFSLPTVVICGLLFLFSLKPQPLDALFLFLTPASYALFAAVFGIVANLHFPNFAWTNEVTVVKQSAATMLTVFAGMIFSMVPIGIAFANLAAAKTVLLATTAVILFLGILLTLYINTKGKQLFEQLDA